MDDNLRATIPCPKMLQSHVQSSSLPSNLQRKRLAKQSPFFRIAMLSSLPISVADMLQTEPKALGSSI